MTGLAHKDDYLETPPPLMTVLEEWIGGKFLLDASANENNTKCIAFISEQSDALKQDWKVFALSPGHEGPYFAPTFNNPPRSKNKKFVLKALEQWKDHNFDIVQLICWNDLGNKYCDEIRELIFKGDIKVKNLGKITFWKNGQPTKFPSRLSYLAIWYKRKE